LRPCRDDGDDDSSNATARDLNKAFRKGDSNEVMRLMNTAFSGKNYSLIPPVQGSAAADPQTCSKAPGREIEFFRHIYGTTMPSCR
jgi:hypothetical protein